MPRFNGSLYQGHSIPEDDEVNYYDLDDDDEGEEPYPDDEGEDEEPYVPKTFASILLSKAEGTEGLILDIVKQYFHNDFLFVGHTPKDKLNEIPLKGELEDPDDFDQIHNYYRKMRECAMARCIVGDFLPFVFPKDVRLLVNAERGRQPLNQAD